MYKKPFRKIVEEKFDSLDVDKNGHVSIKEMLHQADVLKELCHANPEKIKPFRDNLQLFSEGIGFSPGKRKGKEQFVDAVIHFAATEQEKKRSTKKRCRAEFTTLCLILSILTTTEPFPSTKSKSC